MDCPCLEHLQALIILAYTYVGMGSNRLWGIMAILTQQAKSMGLDTVDSLAHDNDTEIKSMHRLNLLSPADNFTNAEERRRAFWAIFFLNAYITTSTGWPNPISFERLRVKLPACEIDFQISKECSTRYFDPLQLGAGFGPGSVEKDAWALCIESCVILNRVCSWLQVAWDQRSSEAWKTREMEASKLADEFETWWGSLPETMTSLILTPETSRCILMSYGIYHL